MPTASLYVMTGAALTGLGLYGLFAYRHLLRQIIALNIMNAGVFLLLVATSSEDGAGNFDPVPRAMVLTGVVVSVSATGLALALVTRLRQVTGTAQLSNADDEDRH